MFASSYHGAQVLMSTLCISAIDDWHYGTRERTPEQVTLAQPPARLLHPGLTAGDNYQVRIRK